MSDAGIPANKYIKKCVFRFDNWQDPNRRQDDLNIFERPAKSVKHMDLDLSGFHPYSSQWRQASVCLKQPEYLVCALYKLHKFHPAEEIYVMLAGECFWLRGNSGYQSSYVGGRFHHPSFLPHATLTKELAFMSVYAWIGDLSTQDYKYEGLPDLY